MKWSWKRLFLLTTCYSLGLMTSVRAQVSSDGTLSTTVTNSDNLNFTINNGDRVGGNLFHSFREFSVPNGGSAVFQNALDVQNIISRVTSGSLSQINGLIQAQGTANLFLLNPAGISFGQNARLNIGGSFFATTADSLLFSDGIEFSATNPQVSPLLTVNIPIGLRFRDNPGNITNQSVVQDNTGFPVGLQVNPGNSLALVGGNVSLEQGGRLTAAGGRIELGGLAGAGTVGLQTNGNTFRLNFPTNGLSNVSLADDARVAVRSNGGGDIAVNANIFTERNGGQLVGGIEGIATRNGGDITVNSNEFNISGVGQSGLGAGIYQQVIPDASGNPGNIFVNTKSFNASSGGLLQNTVLSTGTGNAGNISITTNSLSLTNAQIGASTFSRGNAGNISLEVGDAIALTDSSFITTNVQRGGSGIGGDIDIRGRSLTVTGGSQIQAGLFSLNSSLAVSSGTGGNINITSDFVDISGFNPVLGFSSGIFAFAETGSTGSAGSINITTGAFRLTNFGIVTARNDNGNNGGNITINAKTFKATNGQVQTSLSGQAEADGLFSAGDIQLNVSDSVSLKDGSQINSSTSGRGNAGNISLEVGDAIALTDSSFITSNVQPGGSGIGGDIDIRARSLTLTNGSQILAGLFRRVGDIPGGIGTGGSIKINASDFVDISGFNPVSQLRSGIFAPAERGTTAISRQAAGNINLTTSDFRIADGAVINALTDNSGDAGNIIINANTFTANGGGQVITTTRSSGSAGNINLNVRDRIAISGSDPNFNQRIQGTFDNQGAASGIFANTARDSTGNGGNITIQQEQNRFPTIAISDGAEVTVASQGQGQGGEISITGNTLTLDRGIINASTQSANGGNINLNLRNFIRLRNESLISAFSNFNGNGGNITIDAPFIVAFPPNNDIAANAGNGSGGQVLIRTRRLFGITPLSLVDLERLRPNDLDPRRLTTSDIVSSSALGPQVLLTSPDVDPSRGLVELPETVSDRTQQVAQNPCRQGFGNEFVVTGRGGLPTTPNETLSSDNVRVDLLQPVASSDNSPNATIKPATNPIATRVPAQGWIFNDKGQVVLTAYDPTNTGSQRPFSTAAAACPAR